MMKLKYSICCGLDVHKNVIVATIVTTNKDGISEYLQKSFSTINSDIQRFHNWLIENNCYHVCMESTGKYWIPIFNYLENDIDVCLTHPKHDMKNKLAVLYDGVERGEREFVRDTLAEMLGDIRLAEDIIYSANPGLNSLIKVKVAKAREKGIEMTVKAFVPKRMSISFGDMGVIYGNLIDNAIEASMKMQREKRFVDVETKYQDGKLLIVVSNSKNMESNPAFATTKENKRKHGRGIRSVRRVAEQYGGNLLLEDEGGTFKASLLLTNVERLE